MKIKDNEFTDKIMWTERKRNLVRMVYRTERKRPWIRDDGLSPRRVVRNLTELIWLDQQLGTSFQKLQAGRYYD